MSEKERERDKHNIQSFHPEVTFAFTISTRLLFLRSPALEAFTIQYIVVGPMSECFINLEMRRLAHKSVSANVYKYT